GRWGGWLPRRGRSRPDFRVLAGEQGPRGVGDQPLVTDPGQAEGFLAGVFGAGEGAADVGVGNGNRDIGGGLALGRGDERNADVPLWGDRLEPLAPGVRSGLEEACGGGLVP